MPDLETLLRDVRPAPDPGWAARLDARAAAGFPGPPPRWKAPLIAFRQHLLAFGAVGSVAAIVIVLVVAAVNGTGGSDDSASSGGSSSSTAASAEGDSGGSTAAPGRAGSEKSAAGGSLPATVAPQAGAPTRDAAVLRNASITLATRPARVETTVDRAIRIVDALGGYVASSTVNASGGNASAELTLELPTGKLDSGLAQLSKLAHVRSRSQQSEDVTDQRAALEAAVRDARADRAGLRVRLAKATTDKGRSRLRAQLDRASRRVTQRERRVAALGRDVAYATVDLSIEGDRSAGAAPVAPGGRWTPGDAFRDAGRVLEVIAGVLVIALAILVPLAILAALAGLAGRGVTRRRRERALEMA